MKPCLLILLTLLSFAFAFAETKSVKGQAEGRYRNDVWKKWFDEPIALYVDEKANVYLTAGSTITATGFMSTKNFYAFVEALEKSQEWAQKAKDAKLETTKELANFLTPYDTHDQGIILTFFAANEGQQTDVILKVQDFDNQFLDTELYLNPDQVEALLKLSEKVPDTYRALKSSSSKADEILK